MSTNDSSGKICNTRKMPKGNPPSSRFSNIDLQQLQEEVQKWSTRNFPNAKPYQPLLGATEEIGELCHSHLKLEQGIRTDQNHREKAEDAIADIVIYLADYCWRNGYNLQDAIDKTWLKVKQRDWTKNKVNGEVK
jgi:NTP pyrophosphatase (non-canonical NTP hydrolase)